MKKFIGLFLSSLLAVTPSFAADVKISQLPLATAASVGVADSFPFVAAGVNVTKRLTLYDIVNLPLMVSTYAPISNPVFIGSVTAPTFVGDLTGDVTGTVTGNLIGNADTATNLLNDPSDCGPNQFAYAISQNANLTCSAVATSQLSGSIALGSQVSGTLPIANGGTGQSSAGDAFGALSPTTTNGDLIIRGSSANIRLPVGSDGYVLTADSSVTNGGMAWAAPGGLAPGMIAPFALQSCPTGWIAADGTAVSRATYASLFANMKTMYGNGDGSTTFNLPDFRGRFLRMWSNAASTDPDRASRTAMVASTFTVGSGATTNGSPTVTVASTAEISPGMTITGTGIPASTVVRAVVDGTTITLGNTANSANVNASATNSGLTFTLSKAPTGNYMGSVQNDATARPNSSFTTGTESASHTHAQTQAQGGTGGSYLAAAAAAWTAGNNATTGTQSANHTHTITGGGDNETRPENAYVLYCVKF